MPPLQSVTLGVAIFHSTDALTILQANEREATTSPVGIICGKTETVTVICSQRLDFES